MTAAASAPATGGPFPRISGRTRRTSMVVGVFFAVVLSALPASEARPNLLLFFVDNVGYRDLGCYGNADVLTPHIDRLAAEGVRCLDFYIASPSCSPSRGAILTGRHPERNGLNYQMSSNPAPGREGLPPGELILPAYLNPLGYACGAFGKWNIGFDPGQRPTDRGFAEFLGHQSGNIHYYKHLYHGRNDLRRGTEVVDLRGRYSTDLFADGAADFIRRHAAQPWFVYLPFNAAHFIGAHNVDPGEKVEWQAPAAALARYGAPPDEPDPRRRFLAVLTALDDAIGRVLATVDDLHLRERTLVMLISDNGAFMLPGRGLEVQSNAPLRSGGVTTCEGGVRVPAVFRWPGRLPTGAVNRTVLSSLDVVPLAVGVAGGTLPRDRMFDGRDPLPALQGKAASPHPALHWIWNQGRTEQWRGMREGAFKLLRSADSAPWQLFDLEHDVSESHDLAAAKPEKVAEMIRHFDAWRTEINADPGRSADLRAPRK